MKNKIKIKLKNAFKKICSMTMYQQPTLHEKQHFGKNTQRKYYIFVFGQFWTAIYNLRRLHTTS